LVAYTDLTSFSSKCTTLREFCDATANICTQLSERFAKTDLPYGCKQFAQATIPYLFEIVNNHNNILAPIGEQTTLNERYRRGIEKAVSRLTNVLYGSFLNLDINFII